jgi:two-component system chemotaxis sensor kinase CheA
VAAAPPAGTARGTDREVRERAAAEDRSPGRVATVRVGTDRLDALMNLMGEMVIQRTRLARLAAEHDLGDLRGAVEDMTRVTDDLRSLIMQVRMMPVGAAFMRFPRMVRDLANTLGKRLDLQISGEHTELDRTVIDGLGDPLVHMLRNAVDHGLESPGERVAAGKDPVGTIRLSARHAGDSVVIEVSDDGRGMDPDALRASVVRKGLMDRAAADALSDRDALGLVFLPGVSTAAQTTDVSGRGVGMDAVRTAIGDLNGEVTIESAIGRGSVFTIRLPLTLAIIQALLVRAGADLRGGSQVWAVPLDAIEETVVVDPAGTRPVGGRPCMVLRDAVVPLVWLRDCLSLEGGDRDAAAGATIEVVVVRSGEGRMGLVVDGLAGTQDVVIEDLPGFLDDVSGVAGATILGDGSVALIVDVAALSPTGADGAVSAPAPTADPPGSALCRFPPG